MTAVALGSELQPGVQVTSGGEGRGEGISIITGRRQRGSSDCSEPSLCVLILLRPRTDYDSEQRGRAEENTHTHIQLKTYPGNTPE